jgi:hypothetical protein
LGLSNALGMTDCLKGVFNRLMIVLTHIGTLCTLCAQQRCSGIPGYTNDKAPRSPLPHRDNALFIYLVLLLYLFLVHLLSSSDSY